MLVRVGGVVLDVRAEIVFATTLSGEHGMLRITIPRDSGAWDSDLIDENGGFLVEGISQFGYGRFIADRPRWTPRGMEIDCHHVTTWMQLRRVHPNRTFLSASAGQIARRAIMDGLIGLGSVPVTVGPILQAPPILPPFEFARQTVLDVLTELHELSGQTWWLDNDLTFHWGLRQGVFREEWFVDDGRLFQEIGPTSLSDVAAEIIEVDRQGREFTVRGTAPRLWPKQDVERI